MVFWSRKDRYDDDVTVVTCRVFSIIFVAKILDCSGVSPQKMMTTAREAENTGQCLSVLAGVGELIEIAYLLLTAVKGTDATKSKG